MDDGIITIYQDTTLYSITGCADQTQCYTLSNRRHIYLVVLKGDVIINNIKARNRDGVYIINEKELEFIFEGESEMILLDLPALK